MLRLMKKNFLIPSRVQVAMVVMLGLTMMMVACWAEKSEEDIIPLTPVDVQVVSTTKQTVEPKTEILNPVSPLVTETLTITEMSLPVESDNLLKLAVADLAKQLRIPLESVTVILVQATEWSDASVGCPKEGMMYAQVITPGYLMVLEAQGQQYSYHTNKKNLVVLCQSSK